MSAQENDLSTSSSLFASLSSPCLWCPTSIAYNRPLLLYRSWVILHLSCTLQGFILLAVVQHYSSYLASQGIQ